jgi:hypothetical protein
VATSSDDESSDQPQPSLVSASDGPPLNRKQRRALLAAQGKLQQVAPPAKRQRRDSDVAIKDASPAPGLKRTAPDSSGEAGQPLNRKQRRALERGESLVAAAPSASPSASPAAASKSDYDWNALANQAIAASPSKSLKVKQLQSRILSTIVAEAASLGQVKQGLGKLVKSAIPADLAAGFVISGNEVRCLYTDHITAQKYAYTFS